jgi:hypothetical protein
VDYDSFVEFLEAGHKADRGTQTAEDEPQKSTGDSAKGFDQVKKSHPRFQSARVPVIFYSLLEG